MSALLPQAECREGLRNVPDPRSIYSFTPPSCHHIYVLTVTKYAASKYPPPPPDLTSVRQYTLLYACKNAAGYGGGEEGPERRHGSTTVEYQAMPSLRDVAHDGWLCTNITTA